MTTATKSLPIWFLVCFLVSCDRDQKPPLNIPLILSLRNLGLAYLEENQLQEAATQFSKLRELLPDEPLGFANIGLVYLRMGKFSEAEAELKKALKLQPDNPDINLILAEVYDRSGRYEDALRVLENSLAKNSDHFLSHYKTAQIYTRVSRKEPEKIIQHLAQLLKSNPTALPARMQLIEALLQSRKTDEALGQFEEVRRQLPELPLNSEEYYKRAVDFMHASKPQEAIGPVRIFHNLLKPTPVYQTSIIQLNGPGGGLIGFPLITFSQKFLQRMPKAASLGVRFTDVTQASGLQNVPSVKTCSFIAGDYDDDGDPDIYDAWSHSLYQNQRGKFAASTAGLDKAGSFSSGLFVDYDNDGKLDLFTYGPSSAALYRNAGNFSDVTKKSGIQFKGSIGKVLFLDLDQDGDLDLYSGAQSYRNHSDGTFSRFPLKDQPSWLRDAEFGDFDLDGDVDLVVIDPAGSLLLYSNLRQGHFDKVTEHVLATQQASAVNLVDYDNDGDLDLLVTSDSAQVFKNNREAKFEKDHRTSFQGWKIDANSHPMFFDFDNDGLLDLFTTNSLQQNQGAGIFKSSGILLGTTSTCARAVDYDSDGDLDLLTCDKAGNLKLSRNDGGNLNHWLKVQLVALSAESGKNNKYGIGSSVEVKAVGLDQLRAVTEPVTHFGLGQHARADVVRVVWTNGVPQNHILPVANQVLLEKQVLKGSCAFLYAWDGQKYSFVTDIMWRSALGMPLGIMGGGSTKYAFADSTDEYLKIPGSLVKPKDGEYTFQITEELWETSYMDRLKLIAVDHPDTFDIYVDEKFTPPPFPPLRIFTVSKKRLPLSAIDERGNNLLAQIRDKDERYISNLLPTRYQGITGTHELVLDPGDLSPSKHVMLYLQGWLFPTDASINFGVSQTRNISVQPPVLQVVDRNGQWQTVMQFGFPMGKNKTAILDLTGKFLSKDHRIKIVTNMQIYWDRIFFSIDEPNGEFVQTSLDPHAADLHYRGFSKMYRKTRYSPHWFDYSTISSGQQWRDLTGSYTRYGDVQPLLLNSDDMYVIMNAGDEMTVRFDSSRLPKLKEGWTRDFIIYTDGWIKDGDLNTAYSQTVNPLPFHKMPGYPYGDNESYPNDEKHRRYLEAYNTRKVGRNHH